MFSMQSSATRDKNSAQLHEACQKGDFQKIEELIKSDCTLNVTAKNQSPYYYLLLESAERMDTYDSSSNRQKAFLILWEAGARLKNSIHLLSELHRTKSTVLTKFVLEHMDEFGWGLSPQDLIYFLNYPATNGDAGKSTYQPSQECLKTFVRALSHDPKQQFHFLDQIKKKDPAETLLYYFFIANRMRSTLEMEYIPSADFSILQSDTNELKIFLNDELGAFDCLKKTAGKKTLFACQQILLDAKICLDTNSLNFNLVLDHDLDALQLHYNYLQHFESLMNEKPDNQALDNDEFIFKNLPKFKRTFELQSYNSGQVPPYTFAHSFCSLIYQATNNKDISAKEMMSGFFVKYAALTHPANWQQAGYLLQPLKHFMQYLLTLNELKKVYKHQTKLAIYPINAAWSEIFADEFYCNLFKEKLAELEKLIEANNKFSIALSSKATPFVSIAKKLEEKDAMIAKLSERITQLEAQLAKLSQSKPKNGADHDANNGRLTTSNSLF